MQIADNPHPIAQAGLDQLMRYREQLLAAGFREPTKLQSRSWHWRFYKPLTSLTAFIVNLKGYDDHVDVTYGCASTAFTLMANDADALTTLGVSDDEITLRARLSIHDAADEDRAAQTICQMYGQFRNVEKDDLLALAKEKRKAFIHQIAVRLKPLGFKKKGNTWRREMPQGLTLAFNLQKSSYSDVYYFNVDLHREDLVGFGCYSHRVSPEGYADKKWTMDWQLISPEALSAFLDECLLPHLTWFIDTPYEILGADPVVWKHCFCQRSCCEHCWVQKNVWEANQSNS